MLCTLHTTGEISRYVFTFQWECPGRLWQLSLAAKRPGGCTIAASGIVFAGL
jgi:hypothetical protein